MSVVFTDDFDVSSDTNIDEYPSVGDPDYAYTNGSGSNLTVQAATDRAQATVAATVVGARIIDAAVPTGDQEITADVVCADSFGSGEVRVRCPGGFNHYTGKIELSTSGADLRLYRVVSGTHTLIANGSNNLTAGVYTLRLRATGTNPVALELEVVGVETITFDDSDAARHTSGPPGIGAWYQASGHTHTWVDNVSVDDLAPAGGGTILPFLMHLCG